MKFIKSFLRLLFLVCLFIPAVSSTAYAHLVNTEVGEFYAGMMHPFTSFDYFLLLLVPAFLASQIGKRAVRFSIILFPSILGLTIFLGTFANSGTLTHLLNPLTLIILSFPLLFMERLRRLDSADYIGCLFTLLTGHVLGMSIGFDIDNSMVDLKFIAGVILAGFSLFTLFSAWIPTFSETSWRKLPTIAALLLLFFGTTALYFIFSEESMLSLTTRGSLPTEDSLKAMMAQKDLNLPVITTALLASLLWGAGHALTPGHGKAIVGAYLIGAHASSWHAVYLGLTVTITHTFGVFVLGAIAMFASKYIMPEDLYPYLGAASGVIIVILGISMIWSRYKRLHHHHHDHSHDHHAHHHHHHDDSHSHIPPGADGKPVTWKSLLALGISGGLLPCPSALVLLLTAISLQRIQFGMLMVLFFSLGLAGVLTTIGLLFVKGSRLVQATSKFERLARYIPVGSAIVILLIGVIIVFTSLSG